MFSHENRWFRYCSAADNKSSIFPIYTPSLPFPVNQCLRLLWELCCIWQILAEEHKTLLSLDWYWVHYCGNACPSPIIYYITKLLWNWCIFDRVTPWKVEQYISADVSLFIPSHVCSEGNKIVSMHLSVQLSALSWLYCLRFIPNIWREHCS